MKAVIINNNNALVLEVFETKVNEKENLMEIIGNGLRISTSISNVLIIDGNDKVDNDVIESLVGEGGTITWYDSSTKEKKTRFIEKGIVKKFPPLTK